MRELPRVATGPVFLVAGTIALGAVDGLFLAITTGYFGAGYNSPVLRGIVGLGAFAASGMLLDAFLLATLFATALLAGRLLRIEGLARFAFAGAIALYLPVAFLIVSHRIHRVFGQLVGLDLLIQLAGGRPGDAVLEAATEAPGTLCAQSRACWLECSGAFASSDERSRGSRVAWYWYRQVCAASRR